MGGRQGHGETCLEKRRKVNGWSALDRPIQMKEENTVIDFKNSDYFKLKPIEAESARELVGPLLVDEEEILSAFKTVRDKVVFTNKRVIAINVQGITGSKKDFTSLPYSKVQAFSVETAGTFDLDCEMELWFSGLGRVKFEFRAGFDIVGFNRVLSRFVLE